MCMLCVIPPHVVPSLDKLENSALNNPHGFGFAIAVPSEQRIIVERTMNADESINRFLQLRMQYSEGYAIWHARYATHGSKTVENCHPFPVGGDQRTYLAHNGILSCEAPKNDDRSDTRIFADEILPGIGGVTALDNDYVWEMLEEYTGGSKLAVLTVDPAAKHPLYILNQHAGWEDTDGVWWSNQTCFLESWATAYRAKTKTIGYYDGYYDMGYDTKGREYAKPGMAMDLDEAAEEVVECAHCQYVMDSAELELSEQTCYQCGFCFDCDLGYLECDCYRPRNNQLVMEY